ncbi:hypothetical protein F2Q68_00003162 [Brassica cretica]|uniref:Uncharacterized protein n=1 Tax=Brassica cretica TaxID=69181 RepID=A0A8S9JLF6_BRACR|nr:hypothetical protein F2Q68_00003162 [Brassica cretica]
MVSLCGFHTLVEEGKSGAGANSPECRSSPSPTYLRLIACSSTFNHRRSEDLLQLLGLSTGKNFERAKLRILSEH